MLTPTLPQGSFLSHVSQIMSSCLNLTNSTSLSLSYFIPSWIQPALVIPSPKPRVDNNKEAGHWIPQWTLEMFFCNDRIHHMNAERPKSGQIFHCKHSFFKAPSNPTGHEAHTCPAEHRAPRSGGKHKASQPVSTLQLLLCLWASLCLSKIRCKSGQPGCSPGTISVGGTTALELNTSCKSSWATWVTEPRHRHHSESNLKPELCVVQKNSSEHIGTRLCCALSKKAWAAPMSLQESSGGGRGARPCTLGYHAVCRGMRSQSLPSL